MINKAMLLLIILVIPHTANFAQATCEDMALDALDQARNEHSEDLAGLFARIDEIETIYDDCKFAAPSPTLSTSEILDQGLIVQGLWHFTTVTTNSDACIEPKKENTDEFFEDVYYNEDRLLVLDDGNRKSNFTFESLLARRYHTSEQGVNWVWEYEITDATESTMAGRIVGYWQGNRELWCSRDGTFSAQLFETDNACLVDGEANIRTKPSTKSPTNGKIESQRRVVGKVSGDDNYYWWKLSDDEYVRRDVVGASRSCERL